MQFKSPKIDALTDEATPSVFKLYYDYKGVAYVRESFSVIIVIIIDNITGSPDLDLYGNLDNKLKKIFTHN